MALKGLDIFKLSPKKNCKECGCPTCMAFCMKVAQGVMGRGLPGGTEYFVETDYGSGVIPEIDSVRTVLYEPENPENAIIKGGTASVTYLTIGFMFTFIPLFMIFCWLWINGKIKLNVNVFDFTAGFLIFAVGELCLYMMGGSVFPWNAFGSMGFLAIIPTLMAVVGIFQMVKTVVNGKKEKK